MTIKEKTILRVAEEYARRLGVPCREVVTQRSKLPNEDWHSRDRRVLGRSYGGRISINRNRVSLAGIRHTIAHEHIHEVFPNLSHGRNFERYIQALQDGQLFFRGYIKDGIKVNILDTTLPKAPIDRPKVIAETEARIKRYDTKIKRVMTLRKKALRKLNRLTKEQKST